MDAEERRLKNYQTITHNQYFCSSDEYGSINEEDEIDMVHVYEVPLSNNR
jgi:hypothetical protein